MEDNVKIEVYTKVIDKAITEISPDHIMAALSIVMGIAI
jgi:hypothetical protein